MNFLYNLVRRKPNVCALRGGSEVVIGIHPDLCGEESYSEKWNEWFASRGVTVKVLDLLAEDAIRQAAQCDGVMWRWVHSWQFKQSAQSILNSVEFGLNVPVFPRAATSWHYDEKVSQAYLLNALGVETPKTWVFWDKAKAVSWADSAPYPVVFKLSVGAGSSNILLIHNRDEAVSLIERMFGGGIYPYTMNEFKTEVPGPRPPHLKPEFDYAYFQEFLPGNEYDTRVTVIGGRAFGFLRVLHGMLWVAAEGS